MNFNSHRPTPRRMREAFPLATRESLYTFAEVSSSGRGGDRRWDPERYLVGPVVAIVWATIAVLFITGVLMP